MSESFQRILGVRFHTGGLEPLIDTVSHGGFVIAPSAPVLVKLQGDSAHREALEAGDIALTDSAFMVLLWLLFKGKRLPRISGLRFTRALLNHPDFRRPGAVFWVMPSEAEAAANRAWLRREGVPISEDECYVAPIYPAGLIEDAALLSRIDARRPSYVVIAIGGGVQERVGYFLRSRLAYRPAIICTGAALAFLSGQQVNIPPWADRLFLGWLFRCASDPAKYVPRYWHSLRLVPLLWKFGSGSVAASSGFTALSPEAQTGSGAG